MASQPRVFQCLALESVFLPRLAAPRVSFTVSTKTRSVAKRHGSESHHHMLRGHTSAPRRAFSGPSRERLHKVRRVAMYTSERRHRGDRVAHPMFWKRWHA